MAPLAAGRSVLLFLASAILFAMSTGAASPTMASPSTVLASLSRFAYKEEIIIMATIYGTPKKEEI